MSIEDYNEHSINAVLSRIEERGKTMEKRQQENAVKLDNMAEAFSARLTALEDFKKKIIFVSAAASGIATLLWQGALGFLKK